jgi:hypothetical protein
VSDFDFHEWDPCPLCSLPPTNKYWNVFVCGTEMDQNKVIRKEGRICKLVRPLISALEQDRDRYKRAYEFERRYHADPGYGHGHALEGPSQQRDQDYEWKVRKGNTQP